MLRRLVGPNPKADDQEWKSACVGNSNLHLALAGDCGRMTLVLFGGAPCQAAWSATEGLGARLWESATDFNPSSLS
jgi:hypothetical protein